MGSFNTTCSISRLPIGIGDEVKLFFIVKNPYNDSINCYTNNSWNIFGLPLDAVYDDYGRYKLIEYITFCSELIRKYIFECNMQQLNIQVQPIMTSGQDYHFQTHIQLHEMIVELSKEKHNEHDNWDE
ncbi:hypothetical protein [Yersinia phage fHe-Yen9-03]|uniref:Phage protein n=1 Tax=Yersinia phage fHe-Yen9-03 TaxID=2052743 RepID=A0A2C9D0R7_9CAUD|nr:hypothetical protein [Yersinia phage fHe-Yen9-03]